MITANNNIWMCRERARYFLSLSNKYKNWTFFRNTKVNRFLYFSRFLVFCRSVRLEMPQETVCCTPRSVFFWVRKNNAVSEKPKRSDSGDSDRDRDDEVIHKQKYMEKTAVLTHGHKHSHTHTQAKNNTRTLRARDLFFFSFLLKNVFGLCTMRFVVNSWAHTMARQKAAWYRCAQRRRRRRQRRYDGSQNLVWRCVRVVASVVVSFLFVFSF